MNPERLSAVLAPVLTVIGVALLIVWYAAWADLLVQLVR